MPKFDITLTKVTDIYLTVEAPNRAAAEQLALDNVGEGTHDTKDLSVSTCHPAKDNAYVDVQWREGDDEGYEEEEDN